MIVVDTSVWVTHLRSGNKALAELLDAAMVLAHPFVIGELALGNLRERGSILSYLEDLPRAAVATHAEVLHFIDRHALFARGIGYVDTHLLAAVQLTAGAALWTFDRRLGRAAEELGLAMPSAKRRAP